ncbi:MAG: GntR family transcriptional regulator [Armatimonadota bacterium]
MDSSIGSLNRKTLTQQIREKLLHMLEKGVFRAGEPLRLRQLCEEYGWTTAPLREALRALASEGLLSYTPHCGYEVPDISPDELRDLYEVREVLEGLAARLLADRITDEQLDTLAEMAEWEVPRFDETGRDLSGVGDRDMGFHRQIAEWSGNPALAELLLAPRILARTVPTPFGVKPLASHPKYGHNSILEALADRDPDRAEQAMKAHIHEACRRALTEYRRSKDDENSAE